MGAIYRIYNAENGKSYIGQSSRPYRRILRHLMPDSDQGSPAIKADLLKYPPRVWRWEIIADNDHLLFPVVSLDDLERKFIERYDSINRGYNIMPGGGVGRTSETHDESTLYWGGGNFTPEQMPQVVFSAIADYRFRHEHGMSREAYQRKQKEEEQEEQRQQNEQYLRLYGLTRVGYERVISQYGSVEAYKMQRDRERKAAAEREQLNQIGYAVGSGLGLLFFLLVFFSQC